MIKTIQSTKLRRPNGVFRFKYLVIIEYVSSFLSSKGIGSSPKVSNKYFRLWSHWSKYIFSPLIRINFFFSKSGKFCGNA